MARPGPSGRGLDWQGKAGKQRKIVMTNQENHEAKEAAKEAINALAAKNDGRVRPEDVVKAAESEDSPLHGFFDWDDAHAAHAYRIDQARTLIRSVKVEIRADKKKISVVGYVRDPAADAAESGYISINKVRSDEDAARDVLVDEFKRVRAALDRARKFALVFGLEDDIEEFIGKVEIIRSHLHAEARNLS